MIKKIFFWVGFTFLLGACQWFKKYDFSVKNIEKYASDCTHTDSTNCAVVSLNYIEFKRPLAFAEKFNDTIHKRIFQVLDSDFELSKDINVAVNDFLENYILDKKLFPDMSMPYEVNLWDTILHQNDELICLKSNIYEYTGGAHGYTSTTFLNFKPSGDCYSVDELFNPKDSIVAIAEKYFRESQKITENSINKNGFWFENDKFALPQNIGFTKDSLILHYNPYEIAPYSFGSTEVKIPIKEIKNWIKIYNNQK